MAAEVTYHREHSHTVDVFVAELLVASLESYVSHLRVLLLFVYAVRADDSTYLGDAAALSPPQPEITRAGNAARPNHPLSSIRVRCHYPLGRNIREAETLSLPHRARAIERAAALRATIWQIPTFAITQRPHAVALPCNGGVVSCRGWTCPNGIPRPPMFLPCRGGGFRRCCGVAHDALCPVMRRLQVTRCLFKIHLATPASRIIRSTAVGPPSASLLMASGGGGNAK